MAGGDDPDPQLAAALTESGYRINMFQPPDRLKTLVRQVAGLYAATGFGVFISTAILGSGLGVLAGFAIIVGAGGLWVLPFAVAQVAGELAEVRRMRNGGTDQSEPMEAKSETVAPSRTVLLDLAAIGKGDPSVLTAATLKHSTFPRLLADLDKPASAHRAAQGVRSEAPAIAGRNEPQSTTPTDPPRAATVNLHRRWKRGLRTGDLRSCRTAFAALVDTLPREQAAGMKAELELLADRVENSLRRTFADHARRRDLVGLLKVGEEILAGLPDRQVAADFQRIRPALVRKLSESRRDPRPSLRIVH